MESRVGSTLEAGIQVEVKLGMGVSSAVAAVSGAKPKAKVLEINLTDENDAFFLYSLCVSEEDFHLLKREQNLLVDFHQFPGKLIELLEQCIACKYETNPRFIAALDCSQSNASHALLNIIETNSFRNITHISLQVSAANDTSIKQYLASLVKLYKEESKNLRKSLEETKSTLSEQLQLALVSKDQLKAAFDEVKSGSSHSLQEAKLIHAEELNREKEKALVSLRQMQTSFDSEKREILNKLESQIATLTSKLGVAESTVSSLQVTKSSLESNEKDLSLKLASAREQIDSFRQEVLDLRKDNKSLDTIKFEQEKEINQLRLKMAAHEQQMLDRDELYHKTVELLESANQQKDKLEQQLESGKTVSHKLEDTIRKASSEINKANEIIVKLQNEVKASKAKLRSKTHSYMQLEKLLDERNKLIDQHESKEKEMKTLIEVKQDEIRKLEAKIQELERSVTDNKAVIETNEHVIEWLHKQLNEDGRKGSSAIPFEKYEYASRKASVTPLTKSSSLRQISPQTSTNATSAKTFNNVEAIKMRIQELKDSSRITSSNPTPNPMNAASANISPISRVPFKPIHGNVESMMSSVKITGNPVSGASGGDIVVPQPRSSYFG